MQSSSDTNLFLKINPTNAKSEELELLNVLFSQNVPTKVFNRGIVYKVKLPDPATDKDVTCNVILTHTVVYRSVKKPGSKKKKVRYSVIGNSLLGSGTYGRVIRLAGTLVPQTDDSMLFKNNKRRVIKIQSHNTEKPVKYAKAESDILPLFPESHGKKVTIERDANGKPIRSYLVMEEFDGKELFDIINEHDAETHILSLRQMFKISINLLYALQKIHELGILHRDIKAENILVNRDTCEVRIIDFGLAKLESEYDRVIAGSLEYLAPEGFTKKYPMSKSSEIYSLGLVFFLLWGGGNRERDDREHIVDEYLLLMGKEEPAQFPTLNIPDLDGYCRMTLRIALQGMTQFKPDERIALTDAIRFFECAFMRYKFNTEMAELSCYEQEKVKDGCVLGSQTYQQLKSIEGDAQDGLVKLENIIFSAVAKLSDYEFEIAAFIELLRVNAFNNVKTKDDIKTLTHTIIEEFKQKNLILLELQKRISSELSLLNKPSPRAPDYDEVIGQILELQESVEEVVTKITRTKHVMKLDYLAELNRRCENEIRKIVTALSLIERKECPALIPSFPQVMEQEIPNSGFGKLGIFGQKIVAIFNASDEKKNEIEMAGPKA